MFTLMVTLPGENPIIVTWDDGELNCSNQKFEDGLLFMIEESWPEGICYANGLCWPPDVVLDHAEPTYLAVEQYVADVSNHEGSVTVVEGDVGKPPELPEGAIG